MTIEKDGNTQRTWSIAEHISTALQLQGNLQAR